MAKTVTPLLPEPGVWTGMAQANVWAPLRWKHAKIHRGSRPRILGPHQEAGYTSAVVTVAPNPVSLLQSGGVHIRPHMAQSGHASCALQCPLSAVKRTSAGRGGIKEDGTGHGYQFEALLSYKVTPFSSVGLGGRYWHMESNGNTHFEVVGGLPQPVNWKSDIFGVFLQGSIQFGLYPDGDFGPSRGNF